MRARLAIVAVLASAVAWGGWRTTTVAGIPYDIHVLDAGLVAVMSDQVTLLKSCPIGAGSCTDVASLDGGLAAASIGASGCFWGIYKSTGAITGCGYTGAINIGGNSQLWRMRCMGNGFCGLSANVNNMLQSRLYTSAAPGDSSTWRNSSTSSPMTAPNPLSGVNVGGVDYMLWGSADLRLIVDGGIATGGIIPGTVFGVTDGLLFAKPNGHIGIIAIQPGTAAPRTEIYGADLTYDGMLIIDAGWLPNPITFASQLGGLRLVTYTELAGSDAGYGFGMGTMRDGGLLIGGAVPNPNAPGMRWELRAGVGQLPVSEPVQALSCLDPRFCVALTDAGNVFVYWNELGFAGSTIQLSTPGPAVINEGASIQVDMLGVEGDGDPFWITWDNDGGILSVTGLTDAGYNERAATVTARAVAGGPCSQVLPVTAVLADGWAPHDTQVVLPGGLTVVRTRPDPVSLMPTQAAVNAGGTGIVLTASTGQCFGALVWELAPDAGSLVVMAMGGSATYTPPSHFCEADGGVTVTLRAQVDGGETMSTADIHIVPWGVPQTPQFDGGPFTQPAGTTQTYGYGGPSHVCQGAPGFPGTTARLLDAGAPAGIGVTADPTGVTVSSSDRCIGGVVQPLVQFEINGEVSPPATLLVSVIPDTAPLPPNFPFSMNAQLDGGSFHGVFVVDAGCLMQRGLEGLVDIVGPPNGTTGRFPILGPTPWSRPLLGVCSGGTFTVTGTLLQSSMAIGTEMKRFDAGFEPAGVGELDRQVLKVTCSGVDEELVVTNLADHCDLPNTIVTWTQDAGPSVQPLANNEKVQVRLPSQGFDGLIGATLAFDILSDATNGNTAQATRRVRLEPDPFVSVVHQMSPVAASSAEVVTVSVAVTNTGACRVSGVMLEENPLGLRFIDGSARIDGAPVSASGSPSIGPFDLEPDQPRKVTWLAKVPLLATPKVSGNAFIAGVPVSVGETVPPKPDGCGCASSSSSLLLLGLFSLWPRRRALSTRRTPR